MLPGFGRAMQRRQFIKLVGCSVAACPLGVRAQLIAGKIPHVGFLGATPASDFAPRFNRFRDGLRELGYVEGVNLSIVERWAENKYDRLPELAADLVRSNVDLIVTHGTPGSLAAKRATATIPIVVANIGDPIAAGIVSNLARPGGNITGLSFFSPQISAKHIELLKELMPQLARIGVVLNAGNPFSLGPGLEAMKTTAQSLKLDLRLLMLRSPAEFEGGFEQLGREAVSAAVVDDDAMFTSNAQAVAAAATRHRVVLVGTEDFARAGVPIGYGPDFRQNFYRAAFLVDKILKGAKPADIPFEQAAKFEFILNMKAARTLGIDIPTATLLRADEVIE
jgi:putative ABC transport system substrate-binding protein